MLGVAKAVPTGHAKLAATACIVQPGDVCVITFFEANYARAARRDDPRPFVPRDKRRRGFHWPIAIGGMEICMTDAARDDLNQNLARPGDWDGNFLNTQRLSEGVHHAGSHRFRHSSTSKNALALHRNFDALRSSPSPITVILTCSRKETPSSER
jgi:hypothetical protein